VLKPATFYSIINLKADEKDAEHKGQKPQLINLTNKYLKIIQDFKTTILEKGIQEIKLEISLASASLEENISLFKALLSDQNLQTLELNFASLYDHSTYQRLNLLIGNLLEQTHETARELTELKLRTTTQSSQLIPKVKAYTPLTTSYIKQILENAGTARKLQFQQAYYTLEIIPAIFCKKDLFELITLIGKAREKANKSKDSIGNPNNINSIKIFPCLINNTAELIRSLQNPIKELQALSLSYSDNEGLEINNSQDLENLIELASPFDTITGKKAKVGTPQQCKEIKIKNSYYPNRFAEIIEMILLIWDANPDIHIICAGFNGASLEEIGNFYNKLLETILKPDLQDILNLKLPLKHKDPMSKYKLTDKISIATRNNNFHEIQEFFKYSSI
jgi:hypothetical protein